MHLPVRFPVQPLRRIRALAAPEHDPPRRIQSDAVKVAAGCMHYELRSQTQQEVSTVREALTEVDKARGSSKRASKNDASSSRSSSSLKGSSKGFGTSSKQQGALPKKAAPVDAAEASHGAIDYVQVASWGSGQPEQLGDLQVQRLERRLRPAPPPALHASDGSSGAGMGVPGQTGLSEGVVGARAGEGGRRKGDAGAGGQGPLYDLLGREVASAELAAVQAASSQHGPRQPAGMTKQYSAEEVPLVQQGLA
ncbi:hypothetical protein QJQ45_000943 [Haematococcus lacustris]|nr:hypothetical protein QJQ45_000943 [Haematococcus lacustris]